MSNPNASDVAPIDPTIAQDEAPGVSSDYPSDVDENGDPLPADSTEYHPAPAVEE